MEVTVIIPTRNRWELMSRRALRAALLQKGVDHEVVIVDDGSTDGTAERVRELADPRVRLVRHDVAGGVARARNSGVAAASGDWIAFLDDDDAWAPEKLRTQLDAALAADAEFAYSGVVTVSEDGEPLYVSPAPAPESLPSATVAVSAIPAGPSNVVVRAGALRRVGGFDENLVNLEDWDMWIRLAWGARAAAVHDVLVAYLAHDASKSLASPADAFLEFEYLERKHRALCSEHGVRFDRAAYAHYVAWLQLRRRRRLSAARIYLGSAVRNRRAQDVVPAARFALRSLLPVPPPRRRNSARIPKLSWLELYA